MLTVLLAFAERGNVNKSGLLYFGTVVKECLNHSDLREDFPCQGKWEELS